MILKRKTYSGEDYIKNQAKKKFKDSLKNAKDAKIIGETLKDKVVRLGKSKTFRKNAAIATIGALGTSVAIDKLSKKKKEKQKEFAFLGGVANLTGLTNLAKAASAPTAGKALGQLGIGATKAGTTAAVIGGTVTGAKALTGNLGDNSTSFNQ